MTDPPRGLTDDVRADWLTLARSTAAPARFDPATALELPEPARRWLTHAIAPSTPLCTSGELRMHGEIRLGRWRPFRAVQRFAVADGFVWAATARVLGLPISGFDRYTRGTGEMRWRLLNAVPVMAADGEDITRSAAGRHAAEVLVACPAAALGPHVRWADAGEDRVVARVRAGHRVHDVTPTISAEGALAELRMRRWGNPGGEEFGEHAFGAALRGEARFHGFAIPREITAGWHYGTERWPEGQFIRYTIDSARFG